MTAMLSFSFGFLALRIAGAAKLAAPAIAAVPKKHRRFIGRTRLDRLVLLFGMAAPFVDSSAVSVGAHYTRQFRHLSPRSLSNSIRVSPVSAAGRRLITRLNCVQTGLYGVRLRNWPSHQQIGQYNPI
jgi:hypothetical protein